MGVWRALCASLWMFVLAAPAEAQEASLSLPPPILTIDQDRLFQETGLGLRATEAIEAEAAALASENSQIEQDLVRRELELTEQRESLPAQEFRVLADAFDQDVQRIRTEQDDKARELNRMREAARQDFFDEVAGIISDIVRERGALVVLDRRDVFLSADRIDITDEAIARVNAAANSE